jgi:hypothetical protein
MDDLLWSQVSGFLFCTKEEYLQALSSFTRHAVVRDGVLIGVVLIRGNEIHVAWTPGMAGTRRLLLKHLGGLIEQYGHAVTRVPTWRTASQEFVARLGFVESGRDTNDIYYRIERMNHV